MSKDIITNIASNKIWSYVAIGAGIVAVFGVFVASKEVYDAKKIAKLKTDTIAELEVVKSEAIATDDAESFSGCGGCSGAAGRINPVELEQPSLVSNAEGDRKNLFASNWRV